ncbi:hypothetical protein DPU24_23155 [Salmonella enterica subsp. enterica serovar Oranienburg]|nr:hypothetical protein [Salmonella enterica subsp. enterica serovar Newport]EBW6363654.1 hypothetical protein [Salmonella enterica subsp. enterica serovar Oranienburg]
MSNGFQQQQSVKCMNDIVKIVPKNSTQGMQLCQAIIGRFWECHACESFPANTFQKPERRLEKLNKYTISHVHLVYRFYCHLTVKTTMSRQLSDL